jgi:hypothetical protein
VCVRTEEAVVALHLAKVVEVELARQRLQARVTEEAGQNLGFAFGDVEEDDLFAVVGPADDVFYCGASQNLKRGVISVFEFEVNKKAETATPRANDAFVLFDLFATM